MSSYNLISILFVFCPILVVGQNIIQNGDFETYIECPEEPSNFDGYVSSWKSYISKPHYMNCEYYGEIPAITPFPHSGTGLASCYWFDSSQGATQTAREYIGNSLKSPLIKNKTYYAYYYMWLPKLQVVTKNFQATAITMLDYMKSVL